MAVKKSSKKKTSKKDRALSVDIDDGYLVVKIPLNDEPFPLSKSEKSKVIATTHGNATTDLSLNGTPVILGLNAYIKNNK